MNDRTLNELDPSLRAAAELGEAASLPEEGPAPDAMTVAEARGEERVAVSERTAARLLICTTNKSAFDTESALTKSLANIAGLFAEVHVIVLTKSHEGMHEAVRLSNNLWLYPTNSRHSLDAIHDAKLIAAEQLEFGGGFRADLVIALDAFAGGVVATQLAKQYNRPFQLHLTNDVFSATFMAKQPHRRFKTLLRWYVFRHVDSIRVANRGIGKSLIATRPKLKDRVEVIPQHVDLRHITNADPGPVLSVRFPQYNFFMLFVGPLTQRSGCLEALTAAARMLQYPTISLVMLGDGPEKGELQKRAEAMGVAEQVVISPQEVEPIAAMKEANLLFYPDGIDANEQTLLEAAAAGVPIVTAENELVNELFRDGESALICKTGDISCFQEQANLLLNDVSLRKKLARNAREDVLALVVQDADEYLTAFRESVERAIYEFETPPEEEPTAPAQEMPERA